MSWSFQGSFRLHPCGDSMAPRADLFVGFISVHGWSLWCMGKVVAMLSVPQGDILAGPSLCPETRDGSRVELGEEPAPHYSLPL